LVLALLEVLPLVLLLNQVQRFSLLNEGEE
jgi:hypothetical protein